MLDPTPPNEAGLPTLRRRLTANPSYNVVIAPEWYPWPDRPGLGVWVREQARAVGRQHGVAVIACTPDDGMVGRHSVSDEVEDGIRVLRVRHAPGRVSQFGFAYRVAGMMAALARLRAGGFEPDIVHAHVFSSGLPALVLGWRCGVPVIVSEHFSGLPLGLLSRWDRMIARFVFRGAALVTAPSEDLARHVRTLAPRARIRIAPNPVDTDVFRPAASGDQPRNGGVRALNVGALKERKGHEQLLRALAVARDARPDLRLEIVGDGPLRDDLMALAQELRIEDAVSFTGSVTKEEVAVRMRAAHFFVLPSLWENAPVVAIEAMASGLPVLASRVGGIPEIVGAEAGVLVPADDVARLAAGLSEMAASWAGFDRAGLAGAAHARYGLDAVCGIWNVIYREVVSSP
jgi:glycosyltransferase involved in cell wall biosynthesis